MKRLDQYVLAAWSVLCFSDPFRGKLMISALFIAVFLCCIASSLAECS